MKLIDNEKCFILEPGGSFYTLAGRGGTATWCPSEDGYLTNLVLFFCCDHLVGAKLVLLHPLFKVPGSKIRHN